MRKVKRETMEPIIEPVDKKLLKQELTDSKFLRHTNYGNNEIYVVTYHDSPNLMREIGRLREITFRDAGGGTGKSIDIDSYDTNDKPYKQLIVWDPSTEEISGGYRYYVCDDLSYDENGNINLATTGLFKFSEKFITEYLPSTIELGRSFVVPNYQSSRIKKKALYALDNLWDGLGALVIDHPQIERFFGKVTMYKHFDQKARDMILYFLNKYFYDEEGLMRPYEPLDILTDHKELDKVFVGNDLKKDYKILSKEVRKQNENVPPLLNAYINLSPTMKTFGTAINHHFGEVEETGIMVTIDDIYLNKKSRHLDSYLNTSTR